jgi:amino acid transporter
MSAISALIGTIFPMLFIIFLGCIWLWQGKTIQINFSVHDFYPDLSSMTNLVLLTGILYGYVGIEMSAAHAGDVRNPQKDYPKAVLFSCALIFFTLMFASLAIALVVPQYKLNVISGLLQAFDSFFTSFHMHWLTPILAMLMICGSLGGVNAWILGPGKGLLAASKDGCLPEILTKTNSKGVPVAILLMQGIIFTILCSAFLLLPTISSGFWVLSDVTSILALIVYIAMFTAAIRLRYKFPNVKRSFIIPGGMVGLWSVCLIGLASCIFTIGIGFLPPSQIPVGNLKRYELILCTGVILGCLIPFVFYSINSSMRKRRFSLNEALMPVVE